MNKLLHSREAKHLRLDASFLTLRLPTRCNCVTAPILEPLFPKALIQCFLVRVLLYVTCRGQILVPLPIAPRSHANLALRTPTLQGSACLHMRHSNKGAATGDEVPSAGGIVLKRRRGLGLLIQYPRLPAKDRGASPRERVEDSGRWCSVWNTRLWLRGVANVTVGPGGFNV